MAGRWVSLWDVLKAVPKVGSSAELWAQNLVARLAVRLAVWKARTKVVRLVETRAARMAQKWAVLRVELTAEMKAESRAKMSAARLVALRAEWRVLQLAVSKAEKRAGSWAW